MSRAIVSVAWLGAALWLLHTGSVAGWISLVVALLLSLSVSR